jgi:hypothetical protein
MAQKPKCTLRYSWPGKRSHRPDLLSALSLPFYARPNLSVVPESLHHGTVFYYKIMRTHCCLSEYHRSARGGIPDRIRNPTPREAEPPCYSAEDRLEDQRHGWCRGAFGGEGLHFGLPHKKDGFQATYGKDAKACAMTLFCSDTGSTILAIFEVTRR